MYIKLEINELDPTHTKIRIFDGPDKDHLGYCGYLCMTPGGAERLLLAVRRDNKIGDFGVVDSLDRVRAAQ